MFKRIFWMSTGVAVGAGSAFWAKRKVEATVERYLPEQVADRAAASAKDLGRTVRAAAAEGREAMRATEAELRARVEARTFVGSAPAAPAPAPPAASGARRTPRQPAPRPDAVTPRRRAGADPPASRRRGPNPCRSRGGAPVVWSDPTPDGPAEVDAREEGHRCEPRSCERPGPGSGWIASTPTSPPPASSRCTRRRPCSPTRG
ncbi:MAG: hypothetical protein R2746_11345 [Acidimicrobiales bacterium]